MSREPSSDQPYSLRPESTDSAQALQSPASIDELTDLLGGAIDEIGLMDSRETPPPMISANSRDKPRPGHLSVNTAILDSPDARRPITPRSLPDRGDSLTSDSSSSSAHGTVPPPQLPQGVTPPSATIEEEGYTTAKASTSQHQRHASASTLHAPPLTGYAGFATRPWPAAMLFGQIKNMKHSGDRAKYYARGINELAMADSGLRDWCVISGQ
jgi:hypothetical protein